MRSPTASLIYASKRLLRPLVRPLLSRLRVQQEQVDQIAHHMPILLNAIATQNATAREFERARGEFAARLTELESRLPEHEARLADYEARLADHEMRLGNYGTQLVEHQARQPDYEARLADHDARLTTLGEAMTYVERRGEFIRREAMYEARYGARSRGVDDVEKSPVDQSSVARRGVLRLNVGCGHVPREGFINVDARDLDGVDVVSDVRTLPFDPESVEEIYSSHLVEHFPVEEFRRVLLPHWFNLLRPGGKLVAVAPDALTMVEETASGRLPFEDFQRVTFGDQEYDGDFHFSMYTPDSFAGLLKEAGFTDVEVVERGRRNGLCYEFEVQGERPTVDRLQSDGGAPAE